MSLYLTKTRYVNAKKCPKYLWCEDNAKDWFDENTMNQLTLEAGILFGDTMRDLFGEHVLISREQSNEEMAAETEREIRNGAKVICEAAFLYNNKFCAVDLLLNRGDRHVSIYEVKSSSSVEDYYYDDVSFQLWVLQKCGYIVDSVFLVHVNKEYVRDGDISLEDLGTVVDLTEDAYARQSDVEQYIDYLEEFMSHEQEPILPVGPKCPPQSDGVCGYWKLCSRNMPHPNLFDIRGLWISKKMPLYLAGQLSFEQLVNRDEIAGDYRIQVECELNGQSYINKAGIKRWLDTVRYPLYYLDFESARSPVPPYDGMHPNDEYAFQYSLHIQHEKGGDLEHTGFLGTGLDDPRRQLAEQLCNDIPIDVCTMAYYKPAEQRMIKCLAGLFPDLSEHLMNIHDNIIDLAVPFKNRDCYLPSMKGSYSIKEVLPALCGGDPELDYHALPGVQNGKEAQAVYASLSAKYDEEREIIRDGLWQYCRLDTLAEVKILEKLYEIVS